MTRLELLIAAVLLIGIFALAGAQPALPDATIVSAPSGQSFLDSLMPYQRYFFLISAAAVTLLGLLLEDGRRRDIASRGLAGASGQPDRR